VVKNFKFSVVDSEVKIDSNEFISTLKNLKDGDYVITVKKQKKPRSLNQNSYYRGVIVPLIADWMGDDNDSAHEALKFHFLRKEGKLPSSRSTTDLSTVEFEDYCSRIRMEASKWGIYIPAPNEPDLDLYFNLE